MKKTMTTLTAVLVVALMTTSAFAWGHGPGKGGGCGGWQAAAQLTPEQQKDLRQLHQQFVDDTYETRAALMTKHQQMRMLMETSKPEKAKLKALSNDILELKKALDDKRIDAALKAKEIAPELNFMAFSRFGRDGKGCGGRMMMGGGHGMARGGNGCGNKMGPGSKAPCPFTQNAPEAEAPAE